MSADRKYRIDTPENRVFMRQMTEDLLLFGHHFPSPEGGSYWLGDDGTPWTDRNRETWITARMAHVYSLGTMLGHPDSADLAEAAIRGLKDGELRDVENGGWYAGVTAAGEHLESKQCYAHAFVCLAASSGVLAGIPGSEALLRDAQAVYDERFWEEDKGLSVDTWNTEFTELSPYRGINANMHTVEAFLAMADALQDEHYRVRAGRIIEHVAGWAEANDWRIPEHYTSDWQPDLECNADRPDDQFKPYGATPGHGIEWARLIAQWTLSTYGAADASQGGLPGENIVRTDADDKRGEQRARYLHAAEELYRRAVTDGWNADGAPGIVYTTDWNGQPVVHDRMHWTIAEAVNTSATLYRITGKDEYADDYAAFLQYIDEKVLDHVNGSWFHQLDQTNQPIGTVWPGKSDLYHALQATLIPYYSPAVSIASAVRFDKR